MIGSVRLDEFHPVLRQWFTDKFGKPTDVQKQAWNAIVQGEHTLIASPTGSGKTLAALLPCLDRIVRSKANIKDTGKNGVAVLYITPLKALNNDIDTHMLQFTAEMEMLAAEMDREKAGLAAGMGSEKVRLAAESAPEMQEHDAAGLVWPGIRVGVRTGDTTASTRTSMLRNPPDLLITTPESLYLLLTSLKGREMLRTVRQVIVDEIHDLAASKRGTHLSVSLERLVELCDSAPQRIGVSATQKPVERVAQFLGGWDQIAGIKSPRPVSIVESKANKKIEICVTMPEPIILISDKENVWVPMVQRLMELMEGSATVVIFVNSRRLSERLTLRLNDHVGYEMVRAHHGSVSREKRLEVERQLKSGELKCLVATSSLELGIDVGFVDLVIQIDSPKQAAAGIQRVGRAGHTVGGASRGVIVARSRGELPEAAVLARQIAARDIEEIRIPRSSLDVLSQHVVAMVATDDWDIARLHAALSRSDAYRALTREKLEAALQVLAGFYPFVRPLVEWDREAGVLRHRSNTAMAALMGAGTIPQSTGYPVHHVSTRAHLGELEEEFVTESRVGDVFQLGTSSWMIQSIQNDRVYVSESANSYSVIPFWRGEANGRSFELGQHVGAFLREMETELVDSKQAVSRLQNGYFLDHTAATSLVNLLNSQNKVSMLPTDRRIIAEHFQDEMRQHHLIIHSVFGRKFNRTWLMALQRHYEKLLPFSIYTNAKDNGIEFVFPEWDASWLKSIWNVTGSVLETLLQEAVPASPMFAFTFRRLAETSLLLSRGFSRTPAWQKRLRSEELLKASIPYAEQFPLIKETLEECYADHLSIQEVKLVLDAINEGSIEITIVNSIAPSTFAGQFMTDYVNQKMYEADSIGQELQFQMLGLSKGLASAMFGEQAVLSAIDAGVLEQEKQRLETGEGEPARQADGEGVYRLLKERGDLTEQELFRFVPSPPSPWSEDKRISAIRIQGELRYICKDEEALYSLLPDDDMAATFVLTRTFEHRISFTAQDLMERYPFSLKRVGYLLERWEEQGIIEPAPFPQKPDEQLWISSKVASRLLRYSINHFRQRQEPVDSAHYCAYLISSHYLTAETRLNSGTDSLLQVLRMLQGHYLPISQWEASVLPSRIKDYRKEHLDLLCASGEVFWLGHKVAGEKEGKIAFFLTESNELYAPILHQQTQVSHPELLQLIHQKGASFLSSLSRDCGKLPSEVLEMLIELVWEGHVSNDQYAPIRLQMSSGKAKSDFQSGLGRWYSPSVQYAHDMDAKKSALAWLQHLLHANGLVTKNMINDSIPFSWDTMSSALRQLEDWGIALRGMFIRSIQSVQFSTKELAVKLKGAHNSSASRANSAVLLSASDPANPYGAAVSWPDSKEISFARKPGNYIMMIDETWVLWIENYGKKVYAMDGGLYSADETAMVTHLRSVLRDFLRRMGLKKLTFEFWNGKPLTTTPEAEYFHKLGAELDRNSLVLWPSSLK